MKVKTKKNFDGRIIRVQGEGKIIEIVVNSNLLEPEKETVNICFRGLGSSGIVEISKFEAKKIAEDLSNILSKTETKEDKPKKVSKKKKSKK